MIAVDRSRTILVPLDGSHHAMAALPVARVLARLLEARLQVVHVTERELPSHELLPLLHLAPPEMEGIVVDALQGSPGQEIATAARRRRSSLIVLCTHSAIARPDRGIGRTALEVLETADCPVVLVRPNRSPSAFELEEILVPLDGTPTTAAAVRPAAELAARAGATLFMLHVVASATKSPTEAGTLTGPRYVDQPHHEWPAWHREFSERTTCLCDLPASLKTRLYVATGEPSAEIVSFANRHHVDLIVLAWRGDFRGERAATVKAVIRQARSPVLFFRLDQG